MSGMTDEPTFRTCKKHGPLPKDKWKEKLIRGKWLTYTCRTCRNEAVRAWGKANPDKFRAQRRKAARKARAKRRAAKGLPPFPQRFPITPERLREQRKAANQRLRLKVLRHYSSITPSCACCGDNTIEFLCLDHKDGGGNAHRKTISGSGAGSHIYRWAVKNEYPPMFRVLCHNCNMCFGHYGVCPHQTQGCSLIPLPIHNSS